MYISNTVFNIHNAQGIKLLARLRLGLSLLNNRKFRHNFQDRINPVCSCAHDIETTIHFLFHCPHYTFARQIFFSKIKNLDSNILERNESFIRNVLLLENKSWKPEINKSIIMRKTEYTQRFKSFTNSLKGTLDNNLIFFFCYLTVIKSFTFCFLLRYYI